LFERQWRIDDSEDPAKTRQAMSEDPAKTRQAMSEDPAKTRWAMSSEKQAVREVETELDRIGKMRYKRTVARIGA
jgi:hypothetical protein